jgi:hypothetical protein
MASYESESEALRTVATYAQQHGSDSINSIALVQIDDADEDGEIVTLAIGGELLARAAMVSNRQQNKRRAAN